MYSVSDLHAVDAHWLDTPSHPILRAGEPHVWRASLDLSAPRLAVLYATLSSDERARAARFHFDRDRNHFIAARGLLRELLGSYVNRAPASLCFAYGQRGKPSLAAPESAASLPIRATQSETPPQAGELRFNLSHSHGLTLFAFARGTELGVDVEHIRLDFATNEIAERFFSPPERAALRALPAAQRAEGFFNCWTRKEAYIKATGDGLSIPLDSFDVTLAPGQPARLLAVRGTPDAAIRWSMWALTPASGFVAALLVARSSPPALFDLG